MENIQSRRKKPSVRRELEQIPRSTAIAFGLWKVLRNAKSHSYGPTGPVKWVNVSTDLASSGWSSSRDTASVTATARS